MSAYVGSIRGRLLNVRFFSPALNEDMPYFIYLPPGYQEEQRLYPTLYMLHGNSGSYEEWLAYGLIARADRMIVSKEILPMVIVLPQGDFSYWINHPKKASEIFWGRAGTMRNGTPYRWPVFCPDPSWSGLPAFL